MVLGNTVHSRTGRNSANRQKFEHFKLKFLCTCRQQIPSVERSVSDSFDQISSWENPLYNVPLRPPRRWKLNVNLWKMVFVFLNYKWSQFNMWLHRSAAEPSELSQLMERQPQPIFPGISKNKGLYKFCTFYTFFSSSVKIRIFPSESRRLLQPSGAIVNLDVWHQLFHRQGWKIVQDLDLLYSYTDKHINEIAEPWFSNLLRSVSFLQPDPSPTSSVQKVRREAKEQVPTPQNNSNLQWFFNFSLVVFLLAILFQVSRLSATTFKRPNNKSH